MTNIYVGNLDFSTSEDQLRTLFAATEQLKQSHDGSRHKSTAGICVRGDD
jgi:RNA recognition motif-containing protein